MAEQEKHPLPSPLLIPTLCWGSGIVLASLFSIPLLWLGIISLATVILGLVFRYRLPFLALLFILSGFVRLQISINKPISPLQKILEQKESITQPCTGEVMRVLNSNHDLYLVRLSSVNNISVRDKALMPYSKTLIPGDRFKALALVKSRKPDPVLGKTSFYFTHRSNRNPIMIQTVYKLETTHHKSRTNLERLRYSLLQSLDRKMGNAAPFAKALLLNDRTEDKDWVQQLIQGGLLHLIAISGLHVLFFYFIFVNLLNIFLPKRWAEIIFIFLMLVYAGLCQWSPPVMRAIVMIMLVVIARWLQRPVSPLQIICLSLLVITAYDPLQLFSIGLQLSYLCVITLLYAVPKMKTVSITHPLWKYRLQKTGLYILDVIIVSFVVSVVMLPIMLFYFYRGSLNGIIGNLLGIPLVSVLLPMSFVLMVLPSGWAVFHWLKAVFDLLHLGFEKWVVLTANLPFYVDRVMISLPLLIAFYLIIAALAVRIKSGVRLRKLSYALLIMAVPFIIYSFVPQKKPFTLTVFNAGQGDCTLVEYPMGQSLMVDTGPKSFQQVGKQEGSWFGSHMGAWQKKQRINTIDILVLTHLDDDHAGGVVDVFRNMHVRNIFISRHSSMTREWSELERAGILKEARIKVLEDTLSFIFAGSRVSFLHPKKDFQSGNDNDNSIVLRLDYKNFSALLAGDISSEIEMLLVSDIPDMLDADFLKVPHHGSKYSSSAPFIRAVSPDQACITAGTRNRFHFPHSEILARYRSYGIEPQLTSNGSVAITVP
jgi:competence protein ComEC